MSWRKDLTDMADNYYEDDEDYNEEEEDEI